MKLKSSTTRIPVLCFFLFTGFVLNVLTADTGNDVEKKPGAEQYDKLIEKQFEDGLEYLISTYMEEEGAWPGFDGKPDVALTAMPVKIIAEAPPKHVQKYEEEFRSGVEYLLNAQQENGAIIDAGKVPKLATYKTAIGTMALVAAREAYPAWEHDRFQRAIKRARDYLANTQFSPDYHDIGKDHWAYGGYDYDSSEQKADADMSNTQFALHALTAADLPEDSPVWKRAVTFLQRSQNRSESNDLKEFFQEKGYSIGDDGGFIYYPGKTYAGKETLPDGRKRLNSYGSMTYAGLKSYIFAQLDKSDPRVQSAYRWIRKNYTVDENPGMARPGEPEKGKQALFYYYHTFAKALSVWGDPYIKAINEDGTTKKHHWSRELVRKLADLQRSNGSWKNKVGRWREDNPQLVTSFSLMTLNICRKWVGKTK